MNFLKPLETPEAKTPSGRRGFIFTIDALLGVAMVIVLITMIAFYSPPAGVNGKYFELEQLGYDSLSASFESGVTLTDENFTALTGLRRFDNASAAQAGGGALIARARYYNYPALCGCASFPCSKSAGEPCLSSQDLVAGADYSEVWVTP